ncbi:MAG: T9SS type A sorting domain-containing protein [Paludibacter sp.]|nr:T9SS type A sorting domain-containing protein [Paludibacter sp.]
MKKITFILLAVFIFSGNKALGQSSYLLDENFDSYTTGTFPSDWVLRYPGAGAGLQVVTNSEFVSASNSLKLEGKASNSANAEFLLSSTPDIIWLELNVKVSHEGQISFPGYPHAIVGFNNNARSSWANGYGYVGFYTAGSIIAAGTTLQSYNENQWYKVKIKYNATLNTMDVWIDDVQKGANMALSGNSLKYNALLLNGGNAGHSIDYFDNVKVWAETPTGIDNTKGANSVQISSNPDNSVVAINCTSEVSGQLVSIYNIQGQLKLQQLLQEGTNMIDISALPKGLYVVKAGIKECESIQKMMKY